LHGSAGCRPSLLRLGVDRLELVHLHDPERNTFAKAMAPKGSVATLIALRNEGVVEYIGVAGGPVVMMEHRSQSSSQRSSVKS
jgi:D-threo-aldose 1-dehydrogenase